MESPTVVTNGEQTIDLPTADVTVHDDTQVLVMCILSRAGYSSTPLAVLTYLISLFTVL